MNSPEKFRATYQAVCLTPELSQITSGDELKRVADRGEVDWILVHPLSASGCAAPLQALDQLGIRPPAERIRFSRSHSQSLRWLQSSDHGPSADRVAGSTTPVAFVWDGAQNVEESLQQGLKQIDIAQLDELRISHDVIVARKTFLASQALGDLLGQYQGSDFRFRVSSERRSQYQQIRDWLELLDPSLRELADDRLQLDTICEHLLADARSRPEPPRLALVLSGGGAKCS